MDSFHRAIDGSGGHVLDFSALWLKEAFRQKGCPICYLCARDAARYIFTILYEYVTDGGVRANFVSSLGYCHEHAWAQQRTEAEHWSDGLGTATMYESVLVQNLAGLDEFIRATRRDMACARLPFWTRLRKHLSRALPLGIAPRAPCRVCELGAQGERALVDTFAQKIEWDEFRAWYRASDGLCLPHLNAVLAHIANVDAQRFVVEVAIEKLEVNATALREYWRKRAGRFQPELLTEAERDAPRRAVEQIVGNRQWTQ